MRSTVKCHKVLSILQRKYHATMACKGEKDEYDEDADLFTIVYHENVQQCNP